MNTFTLALAPALSKALAESYSQFVPGNAGINTFGVAIEEADFTLSPVVTKLIVSIFSLTSLAFVGNIGSKDFQKFCIIHLKIFFHL